VIERFLLMTIADVRPLSQASSPGVSGVSSAVPETRRWSDVIKTSLVFS